MKIVSSFPLDLSVFSTELAENKQGSPEGPVSTLRAGFSVYYSSLIFLLSFPLSHSLSVSVMFLSLCVSSYDCYVYFEYIYVSD